MLAVRTFLIAEKSKPEESVTHTEKQVLVKKNVYKWVKHGLVLWACVENVYKWVKHGLLLWPCVEKTVHGVQTYWLWLKKIVLSAAVNKEGHADSFLVHERTHDYWFPWKRCNSKQCYLLPLPWVKLSLFIEQPLYIISIIRSLTTFLTSGQGLEFADEGIFYKGIRPPPQRRSVLGMTLNYI